ncbi:hypothetical protein WJX72_000318 [[Myrmecia] bisecta]|uniref:protein-S-isoprenylcysteine alpha-carbonyl methylesterase n=1 Tax=[Myrmecia] bisecta TaxID=41462 RepID=A0AAW1PBG3_9CHLO
MTLDTPATSQDGYSSPPLPVSNAAEPRATPDRRPSVNFTTDRPATAPSKLSDAPGSNKRHGRMLREVSRSITRRLSLDEGGMAALNAAAERSQRIGNLDLADADLLGMEAAESTLQAGLKVVSETFLVARLALRLGSYLGLGWRWFQKLLQLLMYAGLLMPGFIQMGLFYFFSRRMGLFYFFSRRVIRSIPYGKNPRNRLDLYMPRDHWAMESGLRPVVIYITGGAWTIGYKAWGSLLGRRLSKQGVLVVCFDYRNFPQGTVADMLQDVNTGVAWVLKKILHYGGDPNQVYIVGQSCGAQLGTLAFLTQAEQELKLHSLPGGQPTWSPCQIRGLVGVSGVYNCHELRDHFHRRGLYRGLFDRIMSLDGKPQLKLLSPTYCIKQFAYSKELPPVLLLHGTQDTCALVANAVQFADALRESGALVKLKLYDHQTHTSPLIENPMRGGVDDLTDDILSFVVGVPISAKQFPLCPSILVSMAALVCPF